MITTEPKEKMYTASPLHKLTVVKYCKPLLKTLLLWFLGVMVLAACSQKDAEERRSLDTEFEAAARLYEQRSFIEALKAFVTVAEKGDARAQYNAGLMFVKGEGTEKDYIKGYQWFSKAAENKFAGAEEACQKLLKATKENMENWFGKAQILGTEEAKQKFIEAQAIFTKLQELEKGRNKTPAEK